MRSSAGKRERFSGRRAKALGSMGAGLRFALLSVLLFPAAVQAGIALHSPEFHVDNLLLGRVYVASRDILRTPLTITNGTETPLKCSIRFYVPEKGQLRENAEPIPDASWVTPAHDFFPLLPGKDGGTDFFVSIPNDPSLLGRKFQVQFVVQTAAKGSFVNLGLGGRAFLTLFDKPVEWTSQEKEERQYSVRFRPDPAALKSENVPLGRRISIEKLTGARWMVRNDGEYPAQVAVRAATLEEAEAALPAGYEVGPDPGNVIKISTKRLAIPPHGAKEVKGTISVPEAGGLNKKYFYFIVVENEDKRAPVKKLGALFVHTRP